MSLTQTDHPTSRLLTGLAMLLVLVVVLSAFALSFTVLRDLAALSGIPREVAWLWPVIVDGTITAATVVLYTTRGAGRSRRMPMATLILFGLASVVGNVAHILMVDPSQVVPAAIAVFVGIVPPVGLIMTVEILGGLLRTKDEVSTEATVADETPVHELIGDLQMIMPEPAEQAHPSADAVASQNCEPVVQAASHSNEPVVYSQVSQAATVDEPSINAGLDHSNGDVEPTAVQTPDPIKVPTSDVVDPASSPEVAPMPQVPEPVVRQVLHDDGPAAQPQPSQATDEVAPLANEPVIRAKAPLTQDTVEATHETVDQEDTDRAAVMDRARQLMAVGTSQRAAAEQLGISRSSLSRWLKADDEAEEENTSLAPVTRLHAMSN